MIQGQDKMDFDAIPEFVKCLNSFQCTRPRILGTFERIQFLMFQFEL